MVTHTSSANHPQSFRREARLSTGLNALLGYLVLIDPETVYHKDGALSHHLQIEAFDPVACTDHELDFYASTWAACLAFLGDNWLLESNVLKTPVRVRQPAQASTDRLSQRLHTEKCSQQREQPYYQTRTVLSLTYKPPAKKGGLLGPLFGASQSLDNLSIHPANRLDEFKEKVRQVRHYLSRAVRCITPLHDDDLVTFLAQCLHGPNQCSRFQGALLDATLATADFRCGFTPRLGEHHLALLAIDGLPAQSHPGLLRTLQAFHIDYRWSSRWICLSRRSAVAYLKQYTRAWSSKAIGLVGILREALGLKVELDQASDAAADECRAGIQAVRAGSIHYGFYNSVVVLRHVDQDALRAITQYCQQTLQPFEVTLRLETLNATEAFLGSLPGHGGYNRRQLLLNSTTFSHLFPITHPYQGKPQSPCPLPGYHQQPALLTAQTPDAQPFYLNLHVGDVGHTLVVGPTGSGKSTLIAAIIAAHRNYQNSRVIVLDNDHSQRLTVDLLDGHVVSDITQCTLAPLAGIAPEQPAAKARALDWLEQCCLAQGVALTTTRQQALQDGLNRLMHEPNAYKNLDHFTVQDEAIRQALHVLNQSPYHALLNGTRSTLSEASLMSIALSSLLRSAVNALNSAVLQALLHDLMLGFDRNRPTLLVIEEAWRYLNHPFFSTQLTDWLKTLRKANVSVVLVTQDLTDITASPQANIIQSACVTRLYAPNHALGETDIALAYRRFGLTESQVTLLQHATPKQDYLYHTQNHQALFQLDLGRVARATLCAPPQEYYSLQEIKREHPDDWLETWLRLQGIDDSSSQD